MATIKSYTDLEQSKKLAEFLPFETADMYWRSLNLNGHISWSSHIKRLEPPIYDFEHYAPCWSLTALLKLIPKHISRKDKIHCGQAFIPSFRWEITPTAIYYTDGNNIMDYVSFRYGENNIELIDAVFKMVVWLKKNNKL